MGRYYVKRVIAMLITLFLVITLTFVMLHIIPGGPFTREKVLPEAVLKALEARYHLDKSLFAQYIDYLRGIIHLDLGPSFQRIGYSVNELIANGFPISAKIGLVTVVASLGLGIPFGIISALKQNKWQDQTLRIVATLGVTIPNFVVGTLLIYFLGVKLGLIPTFGLRGASSYIGPVIALGGFEIAFITRLMRSSMLEVLQQDYIRTARAKGLSEFRVLAKHAMKNALIPIVTFTGPMIAAVLTGSFVIERIFAIPGMGKLFVESVSNRDYTVVMGSTVFYAAFLIVMILLVDIVYGFIDPRIKLHK